MLSSRMPVAPGRPGIAQIVAWCNALKDTCATFPAVRAVAIRIIGRRGNDHDQAAHLAALEQFVKSAVVYTSDPLDLEFIQSADRMLADIFRQGSTRGDCDDHCVLFASLAQALGIPCEIVGVSTPAAGAVPDHVICIAHPDSGSVQIDVCAKDEPAPVYSDLLYA